MELLFIYDRIFYWLVFYEEVWVGYGTAFDDKFISVLISRIVWALDLSAQSAVATSFGNSAPGKVKLV